MILDTVYSINNVPIRLTDVQWDHIVERRPHMSSYYEAILDAVENPMFILRGRRGVLVAVVALAQRHYLHVAYREFKKRNDGFIITATIEEEVDRDLIIWREQDQ